MPIYEYLCLECGIAIEAIQKFSDKPLKKCEACGGRLEKQLSLSGFQLKGGGWYADGYSATPKKAADSETSKKPASKEKKESPKPPI